MLVINHCRGIVRPLKGKIELRPGENDVPDDLWKLVNKDRHVMELIGMKKLEVVAGGSAPTKPSAPQPASDQSPEPIKTTSMSAKDAINMVKASSDIDWLKVCGEGEERTTVLDAIEGQLETLVQNDSELTD